MVLHITGFKLQHTADLICFIGTDIMEHGDDGNIPGRCHIIASHLLQKTGNHAGHTETMIHQPVVHIIAGAPDNAYHALIINIIGVFYHLIFPFASSFRAKISRKDSSKGAVAIPYSVTIPAIRL